MDGTDAVLERFASPEWRDWEALWNLGEISSQTCLSRQIELIKASPEEVLEFAAQLPLDEGIIALDRLCRAYNHPLTILSDGLDLVVRAVLRRHGLLHIPVFTNRLYFNKGGVPTMSYPYAMRDCSRNAGTCKCAHVKRPPEQTGPTVYIGDGRSDFCVSAKVDILFAKGDLRSWCAREKIAHHPFATLDDVTKALFPKEVLV